MAEQRNKLRIILVVTTVGEKCSTAARKYLFEKKKAHFSKQNLNVWGSGGVPGRWQLG